MLFVVMLFVDIIGDARMMDVY